MKEVLFALASVGFVVTLAVSMPAHSQGTLRVLADTPLRPALIEIGEAFRRDSGQHVDFVFGASPVILRKVADGDAADVLIVQPNHVANLIKSGKVRLIGPLPPELQTYQICAAAPMTGAAAPATAKRFIAFLASPAAKASFSASGVE